MKNNYLYFLLLATLSLGLSFLSKELLDIDDLVVNSLAEKLTNEQIHDVLNAKSKWQWIGYITVPLLLFLKVSIIAAILDAGCFFFDKEIKYKRLFNIVVEAEFIFLLVILLKTAWFYVFQQDYTLEDTQHFYPLSVINITGYEGLKPWFVYPFQILNLFELAYWFVLSYLLSKALNIKIGRSLRIVIGSYGFGLIIWVVGIMFLTLNMS